MAAGDPAKIWANMSTGEWQDAVDDDDFRELDETVYVRGDLVPDWRPIETAPKDRSSLSRRSRIR